jgi:hypothetical protein
MANDLYGELLARALQRRAPPGHFPAFVTPGEANLLRSRGGGVAPGGGQYMAGGLPAFFSEADPSGAPGSPSASGDDPSGGLGNIGPTGVGTGGGAFGGMTGEFGGMGFDAFGFSPEDQGDHGASAQDQFASFLASRRGQIAQSRAEAEAVGMPTTEAEAHGPETAPASESDIAEGMLGLTSTAVTSAVAHAQAQAEAQAAVDNAQNQIEFEQALMNRIALNPYPNPTDETAEQSATNLALAATATSLAMSEQEAHDAHEAALDALDAPISEGGIGRFSPAHGWGLNSEVALNNKDETGRRGISIADLQALNAMDNQGYAITNPQPTEASIVASQVFAQLNPTITNAVIGLAGLLPGPVGFAATIAGLIENKGLMNIPAVQSIPGVSAISEGLASARGKIGDVISGITDPITGPIGDALSAGQQAVADALSGVLGPQESTGFDDAGDFDSGGVDGGAPDIEIVPPIATETDAAPALSARTFGDVDDETRRRILANIISGLQRTGRPTEGVTAFGPVFT